MLENKQLECGKCGGLLAQFMESFGVWQWCLICGMAGYLEETIKGHYKDTPQRYMTGGLNRSSSKPA